MSELPKILSVRPGRRSLTLELKLKGRKAPLLVDVTGLVHRSRHFRYLADEPDVFAKVAVVGYGSGVAWPADNAYGEADLSASVLVRLAEDQTPMSGADFAAWRERLGLGTNETAELLGLARRTILDYAHKDAIPTAVGIACRALERDWHLLAAVYRPGRKRGRPKGSMKARHEREAA